METLCSTLSIIPCFICRSQAIYRGIGYNAMTIKDQMTKIWVTTNTKEYIPHMSGHAGHVAIKVWGEHMSMFQSFASSIKHPYIISACIDELVA